jgi:hypothetical protein
MLGVWRECSLHGGLEHRMQRLELSNEVTKQPRSFLSARPRRAMTKRSRLRLSRKVERRTKFSSDVGELFEFDRAGLRVDPGSEERADDPKQVAKSFDGERRIAGGHIVTQAPKRVVVKAGSLGLGFQCPALRRVCSFATGSPPTWLT